ncbi:MAG: xanthine dehydrogenase family protein subunit M [Rhodospirillaceae bacterium]
MKPASFSYHAPATIDEALTLLTNLSESDGRILAGGQSLVPTMAFRLARPGHLIDINGIKALQQIAVQDNELVIGAGVRHGAFHESVCEGPLGAMLSSVVNHIAHLPIRMRGTFCGSLAHADPASEWCAVAVTLDATIVARSTGGERQISAREFFQGVMTTALADDELLVEVRLPILSQNTRFGFQEFSRRAGDFALTMALAVWEDDGGRISNARIGLGGVEDRPRRILEAEEALNGSVPSDKVFRSAADLAAGVVDPMEDHATSGTYRRDLVRALTRRACEQAIK